jgi:16S rRNA (uracil1498-N3)-methyltransferase
MSQRFFVAPPITGERAELSGDEARHLASVMRARLGDEVIAFDGSGAEFRARVTEIRKQSVELLILERHEISRELPYELTLAVALPKGERQKWLVEKATELGVARIVPLATGRGVAQPTDAAIDRLRRTVIEASKQCGRNRLLEITSSASASEFFAIAPADAMRLVADPSGQPQSSLHQSRKKNLIAVIGPEGGFTPEELHAARAAGWNLISLGSRTLRVETAAIALAAWATTA